MARRWGTKLLTLVTINVAISQTLLACPNCKEGLLENGTSGVSLARGFELSIYLMLGAPLLILSTLATVFYFQIRAAKRQGHYPSVEQIVAQAESRAVTSTVIST